MLTIEQLEELTKAEIAEEAAKHVETYPDLAKVSETDTKAVMIETFKKATAPTRVAASTPTIKAPTPTIKAPTPQVPQAQTPKPPPDPPINPATDKVNTTETPAELTAEDKTAAFERLLAQQPNAVVVPVTQGLLFLSEPGVVRGQKFTISAFPPEERLGNKTVPIEQVRAHYRPVAQERAEKKRPTIGTTRLEDIPKWAYPEVYDLINTADIKLFSNAEDAQVLSQPDLASATLDVVTGLVSMEERFNDNIKVMDGDHRPVIVTAVGKFSRPEQDAAWNVLNGTGASGDHPIPVDRNEVDPDPKHTSSAEATHVENRIRQCLENPKSYTSKPLGTGFEQRVFFNQLLDCEYKGFTPRRSGQRQTGGTRPAILRIIRQIARENDFRVVGNYVTRTADTDIRKDVVPTVPFNRQELLK